MVSGIEVNDLWPIFNASHSPFAPETYHRLSTSQVVAILKEPFCFCQTLLDSVSIWGKILSPGKAIYIDTVCLRQEPLAASMTLP